MADTNLQSLRPRLLTAAVELHLRLDDTAATQLLSYLALLEKWNRIHNLTAWKTPVDLLVQHVFDSLALVAPLEQFAAGRRLRILDAGSGPGFPAAVLAIVEPTWLITAVDAVAKKVAFIRQAAAELTIRNLSALHHRLESLHSVEGFDVVVSRAFGTLREFTNSTGHLLCQTGVWVAQKGIVPRSEMEQLDTKVDVFHVEPVTVPGLGAERCLIWMRPKS